MSDYAYSPDGKLHTRFSELVKCTIGQVQGVVAEREPGFKRYQNEAMLFGQARHEIWEEEARRTGRVPSYLKGEPHYIATHIEKEFATETYLGVVIHIRPDVVSVPEATIIDYKTLTAPTYYEGVEKAERSYKSSKQLLFYTYHLGLHNIRIRKTLYLIEIWNPERDKILGYTGVEKVPTLAEIAKIVPWIKERVSILSSALKEAEGKQYAELHQTG